MEPRGLNIPFYVSVKCGEWSVELFPVLRFFLSLFLLRLKKLCQFRELVVGILNGGFFVSLDGQAHHVGGRCGTVSGGIFALNGLDLVGWNGVKAALKTRMNL